MSDIKRVVDDELTFFLHSSKMKKQEKEIREGGKQEMIFFFNFCLYHWRQLNTNQFNVKIKFLMTENEKEIDMFVRTVYKTLTKLMVGCLKMFMIQNTI